MRHHRFIAVLAALPLIPVATAAQDAAPPPAQTEPQAIPDAPAPRRISPVARSLVNRAVRLMDDNRFDEALAELDASIAINSENVWAWSNRGMTLVHLNRIPEAEESFVRADALAPDNVVTLRGRGLIALRQSEFERAVTLFTRSLEIEPANGFALLQRAFAHAGQERFDLALADTETAIAGSPGFFRAHYTRVQVLAQLSREDEAIAAVEDMLAAMPDQVFAQAAASDLFRMLGQDDRADALIAASLEAGETPLALYTSAMRRPVGETAEKLRELTRALELQPTYTAALYQRGQTLWLEGRLEEALADAEQVLALEPATLGTYDLAARILIDLDRGDQAARMADELAATRPTESAALGTAAYIHRRLGNTARTNELLDQSLALAGAGPLQVEALFTRANQRPITDLAGRARDFAAILAIDPDNVGGLYQRAWVQQHQGDFTGAVTTLERYAELEERDADSLNTLAIGLALAGREAEAEPLFTEARAQTDDPNGLNSLCWAKVLSNVALVRAEEECRASLALTDRAATRDSLAMVLLRQGRLAEALTEYDLVLADSDIAVSRFARAIVRARLGDAVGARSDAAEARRQTQELDEYFTLWGFEIPAAIAQ